MVGDESNGTHDHRVDAGPSQTGELVGNVWLQPGHLRRARSRLPGQVKVAVSGSGRDQPCGVGDLAAVEVGATAAVGGRRDRMRGEHQPGITAHGCGGRGDGVGEHLDEQRMVEVGPQFYQFRRVAPGRAAGPRDVLHVLCAARVTAPRRCRKDRCTPDTVVAHGRNGIFYIRLPVAVTEVHRQFLLRLQLRDQCAINAIDR
ncbi:Uncharacterised protein [Mycobacterium tuberculosis]|nr:Uncharacterised protein [Mycobacterium tuberculosis]